MTSLKSAVSVASGTIMLVLSLMGICAAEDCPRASIHISETPAFDGVSIDSIYSGESSVVYAMLIISGVPGGYVSGYDIGFEIVSQDGSIRNTGFKRNPGWIELDPNYQGFPSDIGIPGSPSPCVVGFWRLAILQSEQPCGVVRLIPNPQNESSHITVIDRDGKPIVVTCVYNGYIQPLESPPQGSWPPSVGFTRLDCDGNELPPIEYPNRIPGELVARFAPGVIELPNNAHIGHLEDIGRPKLRELATKIGISELERFYRSATRENEWITSRTGRRVTLANVWDTYLLRLPTDTNLEAACDSLQSLPGCIYAEPHGFATVSIDPDDSLFWYQWGPTRIGMELVWEQQTGRTSERIGIMDTGIDYNHPDLGGGFGPGCKIEGGWDYIGNDPYPMDDNLSHGTHVAGILGALTDNDSMGVAGIAGGWHPDSTGCKLYALRCCYSITCPIQMVSNAIREALTVFDVHVLNASIQNMLESREIKERILEAYKADVAFVAAKGNNRGAQPNFPSDYTRDWVISVGASNRFGDNPPHYYEQRVDVLDGYAWSSNFGNGVDFLAPGPEVKSTIDTVNPNDYGYKGGTSMAAPHIAGLVALMISEKPDLSVDDIEGLLSASCKDIRTDALAPGQDLPGYDDYSGFGRVNADSVFMFLNPPYCLAHHQVHGGTAVDSTPPILDLLFRGEGWPDSTVHKGKIFKVQADVEYPYSFTTFPHVWGRGYEATTGWSSEQPNYKIGFCDVVPGSATQTGCQLYTFVYRIYGPYPETYWCPCAPEDVVFAYTIVGELPSSVPSDTRSNESEQLRVILPRPNPTTRNTIIRLLLPSTSDVNMQIFDIAGREIARLIDGWVESGEHTVLWDGSDHAGRATGPGIYFCRVRTSVGTEVVKIVRLN